MRRQRARAGLAALGAAALLFLAGLRVAPPACPRPAPTGPPDTPEPPAEPPEPPAPPAARCGANASAAEQPGFAELPRHVRDFLRFRHCRRFALLQDAPRAKCAPPPFLLLAVKSAPRSLERRELVRRTWGRERQVRGARLQRLFLVGTAAEPREARKVNRLLALEARAHGDVLQWDFHDTFFNLSLKQVLFLEWQEARCPHASFLLSGDDDVFAHTDNMVAYLQDHEPDRHLFVGHLILNVGPIRSPGSKYYVPQAVTQAERYPPYCGGGGILLSRFTLAAVARAARSLDVFPIDDVFLGMCLERAGLQPAAHAGIRTAGVHAPAERESSFDPCFYRELLLVHRFLPYEMLLMWEALSRPHLVCGKQARVY